MTLQNHTISTIRCGKTTSTTIALAYQVYIKIAVYKLAQMRRIPRKLKKRYFKNPRIRSLMCDYKKGRTE